MKNFIKLRSLLDRIPSALYEESSEASFLDYMMDGIKLLPNVVYYEPKIEFFEIIDGKVQLPKYVKEINSVMWQCSEPNEDCLCQLQDCCDNEPQDLIPDVCRPSITYKQFLESPYYKENFKIIRYVGTDKSLIKKSCPNNWAECSETFTINNCKTMYLSLDKGFITVDYDCPMCDENGELLIPDVQILHEFLEAYAIHKHWQARQFSKEEQAMNFYNMYLQKQALLLRQARGEMMIRAVDFANLMEINGMFTKLIKLPEILFYAR